jgi:predicted NBD/HSP70 family sugar kinase
MINYVGVDIGGPNLKIGILDENGKIIDRRIRKVKPIDASPSAIVQDVAEMLQELLHHVSNFGHPPFGFSDF